MPMPVLSSAGYALSSGLGGTGVPGSALPGSAVATTAMGSALAPALPSVPVASSAALHSTLRDALGSSPQKPAHLSASLPDLDAITAQKQAYLQSLQEQVKQGEEMLNEQQKQQTEYIYKAAEAQKQQMIHQIDHMAKQQELQLSQKYSQQQMALQQEYTHQKMLLEKQATELAREYQRRKVVEERAEKEYSVQKIHYEDQVRMMAEIQQSATQA